MSRRAVLLVLLMIVAWSRLLLQVFAMPPYAGLDELFHVARISFMALEGHNPTTSEASIPPYLNGSIDQKPDALPAFAIIGERWPEVVRANPQLVKERPLTDADLRPYARPNYEAQQPSFYYTLVASSIRLIPNRTAVSELQWWRLVAALFSSFVILGCGLLSLRWFGERGLIAAALVASLPSWLALVARAGNDSLACGFVAMAIAVTAFAPKQFGMWVLEALLWAGAVATKLLTWPALIVLPVFFWRQKPDRRRIAMVVAAILVAGASVLVDLRDRTSNPLGVVAFDRPGSGALDATVNLSEIVRTTIASAAWTSGQHWDALTGKGMALYLLPLLALVAFGMIRGFRSHRTELGIAAAALLAFAAAQAFNVMNCVWARQAGNDIPIGGKEGWYWFVLVPVVAVPLFGAITRSRLATWILTGWLLAWDVLIHESALFHDYAGTRMPGHGDLLFRWGPLHAPFTAALHGIAVGPLVSALPLLRLVHVAAVVAIVVIATREPLLSPKS